MKTPSKMEQAKKRIADGQKKNGQHMRDALKKAQGKKK